MVDFNRINIYQKVSYISICIQSIIACIGIVGNILLICVFSRRSLRKYTYSFYCQMKACTDSIVLLYMFRSLASVVFDLNIDLIAPFFCVFNSYLPFVASTACLWFLPLISLDRLLTVMYPSRFKWMKKRWIQLILVAIVLIYSLAVNITQPLNASLREIIFGGKAYPHCLLSMEGIKIRSWILVGNIFAMVLVINNGLNICLIWYILLSRKRVAINVSNSQRNTSRKDRKFAITSICLSLNALVCKLPLGIGVLVSDRLTNNSDLITMVYMINLTIMNLENATSFYVNVFVNSMFFEEFLVMIRVRRPMPRGMSLNHTTQASRVNQNRGDTN